MNHDDGYIEGELSPLVKLAVWLGALPTCALFLWSTWT